MILDVAVEKVGNVMSSEVTRGDVKGGIIYILISGSYASKLGLISIRGALNSDRILLEALKVPSELRQKA